MKLNDRINKQNQRQEEIKRRPPIDEDEETYIYDIRKPMPFINESKNGVFDIKNQTGINTAKSVFDKSIFNTQS